MHGADFLQPICQLLLHLYISKVMEINIFINPTDTNLTLSRPRTLSEDLHSNPDPEVL